MELIENVLGLKKTNKIITFEYFVGIVLTFGFWTYQVLNIGFISQTIAEKYNFQIHGLQDSYLNLKRDYSDTQWRNYRKSLPLIALFATIFLILSKIVKTFFPKRLKVYYLMIGMGYAIYLHQIKIIFLVIILLINFSFTKLFRITGSFVFTCLTWAFCCLCKILSEIYSGFTLRGYFPNLDEHSELSWHLVFGLTMLRMISYNMEYKIMQGNLKDQKMSDTTTNNTKIFNHCGNCWKNYYCLKLLNDSSTDLTDYNLLNYLIYNFYPPLYFSGPIILFNNFIFQINNFHKSNHQILFNRDKIIYILRFIVVFISFEIFNSFCYVNAYVTNNYNKYVWEHFDYYTYSLFCFFVLLFLWFKFTVIWRTARIWAWIDGVYTEENMNRCVFNNYCFEGFWRAWHRSFNIWLIKYIFIPLGGSKYKIFNIWVIFSFVALWHDLQLNLLIWGWFICLFLMPELIVKNYFNKESMKYIHDSLLFRLIKYFFCAFYVVLMVIANLIGFGMGHGGLIDILINMMNMTSINYFLKILLCLVPSCIVMFYVREKEAMVSNSKVQF